MRFCMVTTFYPPYHFGGDAVHVYLLAEALAKRGHTVDVIHDRDSYDLFGSREPLQPLEQHKGVTVHTLHSRLGWLSPLATHQTGHPWFKQRLKKLLDDGNHDVIHFHNVSLIGAGALAQGRGIKLLTAHEYWLLCPLHFLWKYDREVCSLRQCVRCTVRARRPPQWWRFSGLLPRMLGHVDQMIAPSRFARDKHIALGLDAPITVLPYFVTSKPEPLNSPLPNGARPYFLFAGRLVKSKGLQTILAVFRRYRDADLIVAGRGPEESAFKDAARDLPHVKFVGWLSAAALRPLYANAIALIAPSLWEEVFGIVLLEAFAERTPVIVRNVGGMREVVNQAKGGLIFNSDEELLQAMARLQGDRGIRDSLGGNGQAAVHQRWSEEVFIQRYLEVIERVRDRKRLQASNHSSARPGPGSSE